MSYANWLDGGWVALSQALLPSLLGFSLGTYAILFSLITNRLKRALRAVKNNRNVTALDEVNATFFHFILVQVIALIWATLYDATALYDIAQLLAPHAPWVLTALKVVQFTGAATGFLLLIYSITLVVAAALAVYRLATIVDPAD